MGRLSILAISAVAIFAVGCGGEDGEGETAGATTATAEGNGEAASKAGGEEQSSGTTGEAMVANRNSRRKRRPGKRVKVVNSQFGKVIADGRGEAFYLFDKEKGKRSRCYGECARAWPPVLTKGRPQAGRGAKARLLGVTRRNGGGRQVTYKGHPLYYYVDDRPGLILCQNVAEFGGLWLVVKPDGNPVT